LGPLAAILDFAGGAGGAGGERVPPSPLGWYSEHILITSLFPL